MRCAQGVYVGREPEAAVWSHCSLEDRMLARLHTFCKARAALSGVSLLSCQYEYFDGLVPTAVLFTNTLIRDLFLIMRALYIRRSSAMPISSVPRVPSDSSRTAQPKRYLFPPSLSLSDPFNRRKSLNTQQTSTSTFVLLSPHRLSQRTFSLCPPPTTVDGATANTDRAVLIPHTGALSAPSRMVQRASDQLATSANGHELSLYMLTYWYHTGRD